MFLVDVVEIKALAGRQLWLRFADGREGHVSIDSVVDIYDGVFAPLLEPDYFAKARLDSELGTVVWPNGADLCPDVLYAYATGQTSRLSGIAA